MDFPSPAPGAPGAHSQHRRGCRAKTGRSTCPMARSLALGAVDTASTSDHSRRGRRELLHPGAGAGPGHPGAARREWVKSGAGPERPGACAPHPGRWAARRGVWPARPLHTGEWGFLLTPFGFMKIPGGGPAEVQAEGEEAPVAGPSQGGRTSRKSSGAGRVASAGPAGAQSPALRPRVAAGFGPCPVSRSVHTPPTSCFHSRTFRRLPLRPGALPDPPCASQAERRRCPSRWGLCRDLEALDSVRWFYRSSECPPGARAQRCANSMTRSCPAAWRSSHPPAVTPKQHNVRLGNGTGGAPSAPSPPRAPEWGVQGKQGTQASSGASRPGKPRCPVPPRRLLHRDRPCSAVSLEAPRYPATFSCPLRKARVRAGLDGPGEGAHPEAAVQVR